MEKKKKIVIAVVIILALCVVLGAGILLSKNEDVKNLIDHTGLSTKDKELEEDKKDPKDSADKAGDKAQDTKDEKDKKDTDTKNNGFVDNGGTSVSGTSSKESGDIKMSDLHTFTDPSNISFDKRYVLYGDSKCTPARAIASTKYNCKSVYVVLYAKNGKAVGEYKCYVMNNVADAQGLTTELSKYYNGGGMSCGRWNDVVYVHSSGEYVQTSIDTYYKQGAIKSATPEAYLGMGFYFGGMSEYKPAAGSGGNGGSNGSGSAVNPTPTPTPEPTPNPTPDPEPDDKSEKSVAVAADKLTANIAEAKTTKDNSFDIAVTNKYTMIDPDGIDYDERYVLYGDSGCGSVAAASQNGIDVIGAYEVYYIKDGQFVGAYRYFDAKDDENAKKIETVYAGMGTVNVTGKVACMNMNAEMLQQMMAMLVQLQICTEATPEAYMQYLLAYENYKFYKTQNPAVIEEKSIPVTADKLTNNIAEAKTTKVNAFDVLITNKYTFTDPKELDYDERYVLYGGIDCGAVVTAGSNGIEACGAYDVFYMKEGQLIRAYRYFDTKDDENAKKAETIYSAMGTVTTTGKVVCVNMNLDFLQQMFEMLTQYGICSEATPEAYMQYLMNYENCKFYKNPNPIQKPTPEPTPEPTGELKGTTPDEAFLVKMSDSFTYDESQVLPPTFSYDKRYVLFGDDKCGYAAQYNATGFYEILYCSGDRAVMEIKAYVMADTDAASALVDQFLANGMYAVAMPNTNVVFILESGVQSTIENLASAGWMAEATPKAYLDGLFLAAGMIEYVK